MGLYKHLMYAPQIWTLQQGQVEFYNINFLFRCAWTGLVTAAQRCQKIEQCPFLWCLQGFGPHLGGT